MKKLISILVVALIMISCLAPAALAAGATVSASNAKAATGETVTVNFTISGNTGFEACGLKVNYNPSELKLTALSGNYGLKGNASSGMISYFGDAITANGVLFTATFTVLKESDGNPNTKETASVSAYVDTAFTSLNIDTLEEEVMPVSVVGGTITVTEKPHTCTPSSELQGKVDATCKAEGYTGDTVCSICGEVMTKGTVIGKKAHTPGTEIANAKEATCKAEGYTGDTLCSVCGEVAVKGTVIGKKAHTPSTELQGKVDATCKAEGYTGDTVCSACGEVMTKGTVIAKKAHTPGTEIVNAKEATCKAEGYTGDTLCSVCGEVAVKGEVIAKKDHTPGTEIKGAKEATCKAEGYTGDTLCSVCGEVAVKGEVIAKKDHNVADDKAWEKDATGHWHVCANNCGEKANFAKHAFGKWVTVKAATKTETGLKKATCETCGYVMEQVIPKVNPDLDDVPKMGDITLEIALAVMAVVALVGTAVVVKRKAVK